MGDMSVALLDRGQSNDSSKKQGLHDGRGEEVYEESVIASIAESLRGRPVNVSAADPTTGEEFCIGTEQDETFQASVSRDFGDNYIYDNVLLICSGGSCKQRRLHFLWFWR